MRWWSGSVLALALMWWSIGVGHAFPLGPERASARTLESPEASEPGRAEADPADRDELQLSPIPEPSTMLLFGSGLAGLAIFGNRARRRTQ